MTLDEAIKHCEEVAEKKEKQCKRISGSEDEGMNGALAKTFAECAEERRQLAEWLRELKKLREQTEPERKTGKWMEGKKTPGYIKWNCSRCGLLVRNSQKPWYEYCPKCGAKMEESDNHDT